MCTLHDFLSYKIRFIHTSTVTGSHSCSRKKYAYASRTFCYCYNVTSLLVQCRMINLCVQFLPATKDLYTHTTCYVPHVPIITWVGRDNLSQYFIQRHVHLRVTKCIRLLHEILYSSNRPNRNSMNNHWAIFSSFSFFRKKLPIVVVRDVCSFVCPSCRLPVRPFV